ncbi:hypothetical protein Z043_122857 [Scleropages formosus]|uniref:Uncharacterized protein n=1 Tax=Scleropages formosus TaxID=113540 RepID=A0A0P7WDC6_SCLFO|nr:hypothetical protein Z043_122857 [Scleropages formosus]
MPCLSRGLADTRKKMMRDHRRQLRKVESRQKKEKQKSDRILKTFQSAVEAVTPRSSMVMSPGGNKESSSGPRRFSATPLSSWHYAVMSGSSRYSVADVSGECVRPPSLPGAARSRPASSPAVRSRSGRGLLDEAPRSALGADVPPSPDVFRSALSLTGSHLTRSRPALTASRPAPKGRAAKTRKRKGKKREGKTTSGDD